MADRLPLRAEDLPAGTVLRRAYKGAVHEVFVLGTCLKPGGRMKRSALARREWRYLYCGKRYRTLSAVAQAIVGYRWSGRDFFNLR